MKILVPYDGSLNSKETLKKGIEKAQDKGAELVVLHLFNSGMFMDYDAGPSAIERAQAESAGHVKDAKAILHEFGGGLRSSVYTGEGDLDDYILEFAETNRIDVLLCPATMRSAINRCRKALKKGGITSRGSGAFDEIEGFRSMTAEARS